MPQRTCVACRTKRFQSSLLRVARRGDGVLSVDVERRSPGRGAYVCPATACIEALTRRNPLARALRASIDAAEIERLVESLRQQLRS